MKVSIIVLGILSVFFLFTTIALLADNVEITDKYNVIIDTQSNIDTCMDNAHKEYSKRWNDYCKINKIQLKNGECLLPAYAADQFNLELDKEKQLCVSRYK